MVFAAWLASSTDVSWEAYFGRLSRYLMADGLVALMVALALLKESTGERRERELGIGIVMMVDAAGRTLSGLALYYWPGIAGFPVTGVVFVAIMATCTAAVGLAEAWLTAKEEIARHGSRHEAPQFMAGPVGFAALVSTAFGVAAIVSIGSPDSVRLLISAFVGAAGLVALAMGWSRSRMRPA